MRLISTWFQIKLYVFFLGKYNPQHSYWLNLTYQKKTFLLIEPVIWPSTLDLRMEEMPLEILIILVFFFFFSIKIVLILMEMKLFKTRQKLFSYTVSFTNVTKCYYQNPSLSLSLSLSLWHPTLPGYENEYVLICIFAPFLTQRVLKSWWPWTY